MHVLATLIATCAISAAGPSGAGPSAGQGAGEHGFRPKQVVQRRPAIVDPAIVRADQIGNRVAANELVLGVVVGNEARAYPINMLTGPSREIINDTLGGQAIAATW